MKKHPCWTYLDFIINVGNSPCSVMQFAMITCLCVVLASRFIVKGTFS